MCIEGYPDKNTPTVLIYKDGDIKRQIVTLMQLSGPRTSVQGTSRSQVYMAVLRYKDANSS